MKKAALTILAAISIAGCENAGQQKNSGQAQATWDRQYAACSDINAQIAGIDEETKMRPGRVWEVKWKLQVYGSVGSKLFDQMQSDSEAIIKARAKRAELEAKANSIGYCQPNKDYWEDLEAENACMRPVRANNTDGYVLNIDSACMGAVAKMQN